MQGFQRYYPPDFDYKDEKKNSLNKIAGKHALGDRARKLGQGVLITRFELPFNIWCGTCDNHIGMGVRYNAEKKKVGNYHSTPIYSFRCKCHLCSGWFEIRTDPQNTRYVVVEGARQQYQDWDPEENGGHPIAYTKEGEGDGTGDAFAKFEKDTTSKARALTATERMRELEQLNEDRWSDPYDLNRHLRKALREDKGKRKEKRVRDDELADRYGLGEAVRLDLVRNEEEVRDDDSGTAAWLSKADKIESLMDAQDSEEWQRAQAKRQRLERDLVEKKTLIRAETTTWKETPRPSTSSFSPATALRRPSLPSKAPGAVNKLASQLRMNSARKVDPFSSIFSKAGPSSNGVTGLLVKSTRK